MTYPVKPSDEVRPCLDAWDLNKAIICENHKPQTGEEITHQLAGDQHSQRQILVQKNAIWSQDIPECVLNEDGPHHGKVPWSDQHT